MRYSGIGGTVFVTRCGHEIRVRAQVIILFLSI